MTTLKSFLRANFENLFLIDLQLFLHSRNGLKIFLEYIKRKLLIFSIYNLLWNTFFKSIF